MIKSQRVRGAVWGNWVSCKLMLRVYATFVYISRVDSGVIAYTFLSIRDGKLLFKHNYESIYLSSILHIYLPSLKTRLSNLTGRLDTDCDYATTQLDTSSETYENTEECKSNHSHLQSSLGIHHKIDLPTPHLP